jgi:hypothetical protein
VLGLRIGPKVGPRIGPAVGVSADPIAPDGGGGGGGGIPGVTRDASSQIYVPASAGEWTAFRSATGISASNPDSLWLCQEAAGNLADSIGALTLTATGTVEYQQAAAGWSRQGVRLTDGTTEKFVAASAVGPSPATTSQAWLFIVALPATAANARSVMGLNCAVGATRFVAIHLNASGGIRANCVGVNVDDVTSHSSMVVPILLKYDRTNSEAKIYTSLVKVAGTYSAGVVDGDKGIGSAATAACASTTLYGAMWSGAAAEALTDANAKALLTAMGWSPPWS